MKRAVFIVAVLAAILAAGTWWYLRPSKTRLTAVPPAPVQTAAGTKRGTLPLPKSVVVIIEENKSYEKILGELDSATFIAQLAREGAFFTNASGIAHPSQPNYFALFSGAVNHNGDSCPAAGISATAPNLGSELLAAHRTFRAYSEGLPSPGFDGCKSGDYVRKHAPWTHFKNIPAADSLPFAQFPAYDRLPDVAFLIPNIVDDMHSASIERADAWLKRHVAPLVTWSKAHNALVILTFDESGKPLSNHIPTIFIGQMVKPGRYDEPIDHFRVLRTIEDMFGLPHAGRSAKVDSITDCWTLGARV